MGIFDKIQRFAQENNLEDSMMGLIITYIEENELELEEVADELRKDKSFVKFFQCDLIENNEAIFEGIGKVKTFNDWN